MLQGFALFLANSLDTQRSCQDYVQHGRCLDRNSRFKLAKHVQATGSQHEACIYINVRNLCGDLLSGVNACLCVLVACGSQQM